MEVHDDSRSPELMQEMFDLVWTLRDDMLTSQESARLDELVCGSRVARELYFDLIVLVVGLRWNLSACSEANLTVLFPALHPESIDSSVHHRAMPAASPFYGRWHLSSRLVGLAASILLVGYFAILVGLSVHRHNQRLDRNRLEQLAVVELYAKLVRQDDCYWDKSPGDPRTSRRLYVRKGLAKLKFASGATVAVQGPAEFEVRSASSGFLHSGRLVATVPAPAIGFTIDTATATVTDLGTEFALAVVESGETQVNVIRGLVSVRPESTSTQTRPAPVLVQAGEARRVLVNGTVQVANTGALQGSIKGVTAKASTTFSYPEGFAGDHYAPIHVVDNSGLFPGVPAGVGHSVLPLGNKSGTMWLTVSRERGKRDDHPWLVVDLGKLHNVTNFHVWNYNESGGSWRGIRDVVIHYSSTNPEGDEYLLGSYVFAKAPELGKEYTGENFAAEFQARYIRLEIKSNWGGNDDSYGLAEIQFDGKPINDGPP